MALYFPPIENFVSAGTTEGQFKAAFTSLHAVIANLFAGSSAPGAVFFNPSTISANVEIPAGFNGVSAGPLTIAESTSVTVADGSTWSIA